MNLLVNADLLNQICKYCEDKAIYDKLSNYNDFYYKLKSLLKENEGWIPVNNDMTKYMNSSAFEVLKNDGTIEYFPPNSRLEFNYAPYFRNVKTK